MWGGSMSFDTPMLWSIGFLTTFLFGGLTGIILASPPLDFHVSDSYFVVAHFHYVVFGTVVFAMFAGLLLLVAEDDRPDARRAARQGALLAAVHRLPHHVPGAALAGRRGHAAPLRRLPARTTGFTTLNQVSTVGAFLLGASTLPFLYNVYDLAQGAAGRASTTRGAGAARWSGRRRCPPPRHNFVTHPADPLGVAGLRPAPPGDRRDRAGGQRGRARGPASPTPPTMDGPRRAPATSAR